MAVRKLKPIEERDQHAAAVLDAFDKLEPSPRDERFVVESGAGFVLDASRLEMISDPVSAARLKKHEAETVAARLEAGGFAARLIPIVFAPIVPQNDQGNGRL